MKIDPEKLEQATDGLKVSAIDKCLGRPHGYFGQVKQRARRGCEFEPEIVEELEKTLDCEIRLEKDARDREEGKEN